jgi:hypothetical protein
MSSQELSRPATLNDIPDADLDRLPRWVSIGFGAWRSGSTTVLCNYLVVEAVTFEGEFLSWRTPPSSRFYAYFCNLCITDHTSCGECS